MRWFYNGFPMKINLFRNEGVVWETTVLFGLRAEVATIG